MRKHRRLKWMPLYLLFPLTVVLLLLENEGQMSNFWRAVILGATAILIGALALIWIERNPELVGGERTQTHLYRVISYPWSVFQRSLSATGATDRSESEDAPNEQIPIRHDRPYSGD